MKLTKKEIKSISLNYNLGEPFKINKIDDDIGLINTNFILHTDKGKFVLRFLRKNADDKYIEERKLEFRVINFLKENKYPYDVSLPIKNNNKEIISSLRKRKYWVYRYIDGEKKKKLNNIQVKEIAKALSIYHKVVSNIKGNNNPHKLDWLLDKYRKMRVANRRKKLNKIMLKNLDYFQKNLDEVLKIKFEGKTLPIHADFHQGNILFNGNKVVGILDFDNIFWSFKEEDIASSIKSVCRINDYLDEKKIRVYLTEYKKYNILTKGEIEMIKPLIIKNYCITFWWAYEGKMKDESKREFLMGWAYNGLKSVEKVDISL